MFDPEVILVPLGISMIMLAIGGMVAIIKWASWNFDPRRSLSRRGLIQNSALNPDERLKALEVYRSLASEKLAVLNTAVAMGYDDKELAKLDKRLEQLIGVDALKSVIRGEAPLGSAELDQHDLAAELRSLRGSIEA